MQGCGKSSCWELTVRLTNDSCGFSNPEGTLGRHYMTVVPGGSSVHEGGSRGAGFAQIFCGAAVLQKRLRSRRNAAWPQNSEVAKAGRAAAPGRLCRCESHPLQSAPNHGQRMVADVPGKAQRPAAGAALRGGLGAPLCPGSAAMSCVRVHLDARRAEVYAGPVLEPRRVLAVACRSQSSVPWESCRQRAHRDPEISPACNISAVCPHWEGFMM